MKRYNTPHRHRVIKTRLTEEEYAEFSERVTLCKMSQAEFIRQALIKSSIRPRRLVHECCNYDNGNCIVLDNGEPCVCVQSISYAAAIRIWAGRDRKGTGKKGIPDYSYKEGESL